MQKAGDLGALLRRIDGRGYKAYKDIKGAYDFASFTLFIDHIQGDPFASPSRVRVRIDQSVAKFPKELYRNEVRRVALEDYLTRGFAEAIHRVAKRHRGSGKSGLIETVNFGQAVLERTAMKVTEEYVEASFFVGLPARGRTILGQQAAEMLLQETPEIVRRSLLYPNLSGEKASKHVQTSEDASYLRSHLEEQELVAFVANGSILPRESGVVDRPMSGTLGHSAALRANYIARSAAKHPVPFQSPPELEVEFQLPNRGPIKGMGVPKGITLIVGGGYHGKSTLLDAIASGVYNHIPGDGREFVATIYDAVVIRAEDGRFVENVDISPFISNLPSDVDTRSFSTLSASGSTSQAANIMEALEVGAKLLLIDEDTSATNFMIRDERMQELVKREKEPITPLIDKVGLLYQEKEVSTALVMGGSGDYFDVTDTVIMMDAYTPQDVTEEARQIARKHRDERKPEGGSQFGDVKARKPLPASINPRRRSGKVKIRAGRDAIQFGHQGIDLTRIHQIAELPQVRSIGDIVWYLAREVFDSSVSLGEALDMVEDEVARKGLQSILLRHAGDYALPRRYEIAAALNRLRSLHCKSY